MKYLICLFLSLGGAFLAAQNITDSLEAHFQFDGNLFDSTGNNNDLKLDFGNLAFKVVSGSDLALQLSGSDRMISSTAFDNSWYTETSISVWFKNPDAGSGGQLIVQGAFLGFGIRLEPSGQVLGFCGGASVNGYLSTTSGLDDDQWHHVVVTSNGTETKVYIDGVFDGSIPENLYTGNGGNNEVIFLGMTSFSTYEYTGLLNDLRIYSRELNATEVGMLFNGNIGMDEVTSTEKHLFEVYPNPGTGKEVMLRGSQTHKIWDASVYNLAGVKLAELIPFHGDRFGIYPTLKEGSYILKVNTENGTHVSKITVGNN